MRTRDFGLSTVGLVILGRVVSRRFLWQLAVVVVVAVEVLYVWLVGSGKLTEA